MQHRALRPVLALCTLTALAIGCQADEPADVDSARAGWRSAEVAMAEAGLGVQWSGSGSVSSDGVSAMVTGRVSCPEGGSLRVDADAHSSENLVQANLEIEFDGCAAEGVVLDGYLEYAAEVTDTKVSASITGDLSFSGDAQGSCEVDIGATVDQTGGATNVSSHGNMCGFGYSELFV
jgi:hypothetical protein